MILANKGREVPGDEAVANWTVALICTVISVFIMIYYIMVWSGLIKDISHTWTYQWMMTCSVLLMVAVATYSLSDGKAWWVRYILMASVMFSSLIISVAMGGVYLVFVLPILLCILYYNKAFNIIIAVLSGP